MLTVSKTEGRNFGTLNNFFLDYNLSAFGEMCTEIAGCKTVKHAIFSRYRKSVTLARLDLAHFLLISKTSNNSWLISFVTTSYQISARASETRTLPQSSSRRQPPEDSLFLAKITYQLEKENNMEPISFTPPAEHLSWC